MTNVNVSPELQMSKLGQEVDVAKIQKIVTTFMTKCVHRFFVGMDLKFAINISQRHLAPLEKCMWMEDRYVDWIVGMIVGEQFKHDMQTIVVMPQELTKMHTLYMSSG